MPWHPIEVDHPYCSNGHYPLAGLVDSSKCSECGRPIVEVLACRNRLAESGTHYRPAAALFGAPLVDVALRPKQGEPRFRP